MKDNILKGTSNYLKYHLSYVPLYDNKKIQTKNNPNFFKTESITSNLTPLVLALSIFGFSFLLSLSLNFESNILQPILLNKSSIPKDLHADVILKIASISFAKFFFFFLFITSFSTRSHLFPANPMTKLKKNKKLKIVQFLTYIF